jgi:hypothetical protein
MVKSETAKAEHAGRNAERVNKPSDDWVGPFAACRVRLKKGLMTNPMLVCGVDQKEILL